MIICNRDKFNIIWLFRVFFQPRILPLAEQNTLSKVAVATPPPPGNPLIRQRPSTGQRKDGRREVAASRRPGAFQNTPQHFESSIHDM